MLYSYPSAWLCLTLPFLSACLIRNVPALLGLAGRHNRAMRLLGVTGLAALLVALSGVIAPTYGILVMVVGGLVSGFSVFTRSWGDHGGDDWRRRRPPPDEPPPPPDDGGLLDWELFDRLRASWERQPVAR